MIIKEGSLLQISDNSGAKIAKCIKILGGYKKKTAVIGDLIIVSIQKTRDKVNNKKSLKVAKKDIFKAVIVKTKLFINKKSRIKFKFKNNFIVLIDKQNNPVGTRIVSFISKKLKKNYNKVLSISTKKFENIAKLVIALVCRIKGCEFNSRYFRKIYVL